MKTIKLFLVPAAILALNVAQAEPIPAKQVTIPFSKQKINCKKHTGLFFNYDLQNAPNKRIVCKFDHTYKNWFEFPLKGQVLEGGTFGGSMTVMFALDRQAEVTPKGDDIVIFFVDKSGTIKIHDEKGLTPNKSFASCQYE